MMQGRLISGSGDAVWRGAALDSRAVEGGELFFALPGEHTDGHRFVSLALDRGAAGAIVQEAVSITSQGAVIQVDDTLRALHRMTRRVRDRMPRNLVAITGSAGKTTTKEILAAMLAQRFKVARNPGNLNNLLGFPIALLGIPDDTEWMVAEMGMSTPGELSQISQLGRPDVAVFTNVLPVHLEFFGSLRAIAEAKSELLDGLDQSGLLVANRDDPEVEHLAAAHQGRVVWYSISDAAQYTVADLRAAGEGEVGTQFRLLADDAQIEIHLPLHGLYNVGNFLAAAACAHCLGVSLSEIQQAASHIVGPERRGIVHRLTDQIVVIDDSYNSNPAALSQALRSAAEVQGHRHWAILGEMLELGESAGDFHLRAGAEAAQLGFSPVVGVGELAQKLSQAAGGAGAESAWFESAKQAADSLVESLRPGDVVLVKGSRGVGLEAVVEAFLAAVEVAS